jgi:hypothetical protein
LSTFLPFIAWHVRYVTTDTREAYFNKYRKYLAAIETAVPMSFPSLDDYDARLFPKKSIAGVVLSHEAANCTGPRNVGSSDSSSARAADRAV